MKNKVYLAGGMFGEDWQNKVTKEVGLEKFIFFNPREHQLAEPTQYSVWDMHYIKNSDIIFSFLQKDNPSGFGLSLEIGYAKALSKTIILIDEKSENDKVFKKYFEIVRKSASIVFTNLEEGIFFLKKFENGVIVK